MLRYQLWQNHPNYAGPCTPVIVLKTSDCCAREPDNFGSLSGVLEEPRIIHFQHPIMIITEDIAVLQQLIQKYYIRVNERKYYKP